MEIGHSKHNITYLTPSKGATNLTSPYAAVWQKLSATENRPLQLNLQGERLHQLINKGWPVADLIVKEIQLWSDVLGSEAIGKRYVDSIHLLHPHRFIEPFELTRVMHTLANAFVLKSDDPKNFLVLSSPAEISGDGMALLKGLKFSHVQLVVNVNDLQSLEMIAQKAKIIRQFDFASLGIQLSHADCLDTIRQFIAELKKQCSPDYICAGSELYQFEIISNDEPFTPPLHELSAKRSDRLELGPSAFSRIGDIHVNNFTDPTRYKDALDRNCLPILLGNT